MPASRSARLVALAAAAFAASTLAGTAARAADDSCDIDRPVMFAGLDYQSAAFHTALAKFIVKTG